MKLNCDLGESFGLWKMGLDAQVMPHINLANIACGFHASDPLTMSKTLSLAKQHQVSIGAHPAYPDLVGFGRRSMACSSEELQALFVYQIGALQALAVTQGLTLSYVKPHGALYNDMMKDIKVFNGICQAISRYNNKLALMIQALPDTHQFQEVADRYGITLWFEAFADRNYQDNGLLVPRSQANAVITEPKAVLARCQTLLEHGHLLSENSNTIEMQVDTLCVHGDNPSAVDLVKQLNDLIKRSANTEQSDGSV